MHVLVEELSTGDAIGTPFALSQHLVHLHEPGPLGGDLANDLVDPTVRPKLQSVAIPRESERMTGNVAISDPEATSGHPKTQLCIGIVDLRCPPVAGDGLLKVPRRFQADAFLIQAVPLLPLGHSQILTVQRAQRRAIPQVDANRGQDDTRPRIHRMPTDSREIHPVIAIHPVPLRIIECRIAIVEIAEIPFGLAALSRLRIRPEQSAKQLPGAGLLDEMENGNQGRMSAQEAQRGLGAVKPVEFIVSNIQDHHVGVQPGTLSGDLRDNV